MSWHEFESYGCSGDPGIASTKFEEMCTKIFLKLFPILKTARYIGQGQFPAFEGVYEVITESGQKVYYAFQSKYTEDFWGKAEDSSKVTTAALRSSIGWTDAVNPTFEKIVFFGSKDYRNSPIKQRIISNLQERVNIVADNIEFYNKSQIKHLLENNDDYIGIKTKYFERLPEGVRRYEEWHKANHSLFEKQLYTNDALDNHLQTIKTFILNKPDRYLRVVGLSGLGKTKLICEVCKQEPNISKNILYCDANIIGDHLKSAVSTVLDIAWKGALIIDNCTKQQYGEIREICDNHIHKNLKVIAIGHDYSELRDLDTPKIAITFKDCEDIPKRILKEACPTISEQDLDMIVKFADGFPLVADIIASNLPPGELFTPRAAAIRDTIDARIGGLLERFIGYKVDDIHYKVYQAGSLFSSIGYADDVADQLLFVMKSLFGEEFAKNQVNDAITHLVAKGICEKKGNYVIMKPNPITIKMTKNLMADKPSFFETIDKHIQDYTDQFPNGELDRKFLQRFVDLKHSSDAVDLTTMWLKGPFSKAEFVLSVMGSRMLSYLAEVNPNEVLSVLKSVYQPLSKEDLVEMKDSRRSTLEALTKIIFHPENFIEGTKLLCNLAIAENEHWSNNSTGILNQLAHIYLAGTSANLEARMNIAEYLINSTNTDEIILGINYAGHGLHSSYFSRMMGSEKQGGLTALIDYQPSGGEVISYWQGLLTLLLNKYKRDVSQEVRRLIKKTVEDNVLGMITAGALTDIEQILSEFYNTMGGWLEIIPHLTHALRNDKLPSDEKDKVQKLIKEFSPTNLEERLNMNVKLGVTSTGEDDRIGSKVTPEIIQLCNDILEQDIVWLLKNIDGLLFGDIRWGGMFGKILGERLDKKSLYRLVDHIIQQYEKSEKDEANLGVLGGILTGMNDIEYSRTIISYFIEKSKHSIYAYYLTSVCEYELLDIVKLVDLVRDKKVDPIYFDYYFFGARLLAKLRLPDIKLLFDKLLSLGAEGKWIIIRMVGVLDHKEALFETLKPQIADIICDEHLHVEHKFKTSDQYYWEHIVEGVLPILSDDQKTKLIKQIYNSVINDRNYDLNMHSKRILLKLFNENFEDTWNSFFDLEDEGEGMGRRYLRTYLNDNVGFGLHNEAFADVITDNHIEFIMKWISSLPEERLWQVAGILPIIKDNRLTNIALAFIETFGSDDETLLNEIGAQIGTGSRTGPYSGRLEREKTVYMSCLDSKQKAVKVWATENIQSLEKRIEKEKNNEEAKRL